MIARPGTALLAALLCGVMASPSAAVEYEYRKAPGNLMVPQLGMTAAEAEGAILYNEFGEPVGEIEAVLVGPQGMLAGVGVEVGDGFLGIGERDVFLHFDQLHRRGDRLATLLSQPMLNAQPRWDD